MIFIIVMSVNLLGDGVRDALDPRLRSGALSRPAAATRVERTDIPETEPTEALLEVEGLRTEFQVGPRVYRAAGGVGFSVAPGECLGIVGESGSGKSVTALSLLGLVASPPGVITAGAVRLSGSDTLSMTGEQLRRVRGNRAACIFQDPLATFHPLYTVGDQMVEAMRAHRRVSRREAWDHAVSLLRKVRIPNAAARARAWPHELSGGMRQRVGIALALVNDPDLVIADEPTTALDVTVQAQVLALLDELRRERGLALVFITHDFGVVAQLCDRVAVMYAGRIVETGTTAEVLARPRHPYTRGLIACVPEPGGGRRTLDAIPGLPPRLDALPDGCAFAPRCDRAQAACREGEIALRRDGAHAVRCLFPEGAAS